MPAAANSMMATASIRYPFRTFAYFSDIHTSNLISLENPQHTGYFPDYVGDGEAGRDHDNCRHTEFE